MDYGKFKDGAAEVLAMALELKRRIDDMGKELGGRVNVMVTSGSGGVGILAYDGKGQFHCEDFGGHTTYTIDGKKEGK